MNCHFCSNDIIALSERVYVCNKCNVLVHLSNNGVITDYSFYADYNNEKYKLSVDINFTTIKLYMCLDDLIPFSKVKLVTDLPWIFYNKISPNNFKSKLPLLLSFL